jgi:hypothetical protein
MSGGIRMRQICLVARHLAPVVDEIKSVLQLPVCHRDPGVGKYGLENALFPVGDGFLEVVAPVREGTTAGRYLDRRGGDGGYMVITQCDDLASRRRRCEALGVRIANEIGYPDYHELQLHPRDVGAAMLSFAWQEGARSPGGPWHPAAVRGAAAGEPSGYPAVRGAAAGEPSGYPAGRGAAAGEPSAAGRPGLIRAMTAAELQSEDPERLARRWSEVIERPVSIQDGQRVIELDDAILRFTEATDGRGEGLAGLDLACTDPARRGLVLICGIRFRLLS